MKEYLNFWALFFVLGLGLGSPVWSQATLDNSEIVEAIVSHFRVYSSSCGGGVGMRLASKQFALDRGEVASYQLKGEYFDRRTPLVEYLTPDLMSRLNSLVSGDAERWDQGLVERVNVPTPKTEWVLKLSKPVITPEFPDKVFFLYSEEHKGYLHSVGVLKFALKESDPCKRIEKLQYVSASYVHEKRSVGVKDGRVVAEGGKHFRVQGHDAPPCVHLGYRHYDLLGEQPRFHVLP